MKTIKSDLLISDYVCLTYEPVHIVAFSLPFESSVVAQWLEHLTGDRKVVCSIPVSQISRVSRKKIEYIANKNDISVVQLKYQLI